MSVINNSLLATPEGYQISRSVRLRSSASAYFSATLGSGNKRTFTYSLWVKRGTLGVAQTLLGTNSGTAALPRFYFTAADQLEWSSRDSSSVIQSQITTTAVYRDPSAWYHIVFAYDTTQAVAADRLSIYVNGALQAVTITTALALNEEPNSTFPYGDALIGIYRTTSFALPFDGYLTEVNFIDGQALTPSSFGQTNAVTGVWEPKKYAGTYGTNGFYLNFFDNSAATATAIGKDYSGNNNNWTPNNISVTAGVTYDSMLDVPTLYADGGNGRGNYATWNPTFKPRGGSGTATLTNGNLTATATSTAPWLAMSSIGVTSGKWYCEFTLGANSTVNAYPYFGVDAFNEITSGSVPGGSTNGVSYNQSGQKYTNNTASSYGTAWSNGDVIGLAFDLDSAQRTATFYRNGTSQGSINFNTTTEEMVVGLGLNGSGETGSINFGQRPFSYTPPTGFKALNTQNLPEPTIKKGNQFFDVSTWTGDQTARTITNSGMFQPDLVWTKSRNTAESHRLSDSVRGGNGTTLYTLNSDTTGSELTDTDITGFASNGFNIRAGTNTPNITGRTYVGWQWKEGATQGFDIVTYTGNGTVQSVPHNLGVTPAFYIVKSRSVVVDWVANHKSLTTNQYLVLNQTAAVQSAASVFNGGARTSTTFDVGVSGGASATTNQNLATYVAYIFAEVAGFSKFGSYTGNGSADGPFIYCGFRPKFVLYKRTNAVSNWFIDDSSRSGYNVITSDLLAEATNVEASYNGGIDFLSNGFKQKATANGNASGGTYIFMAFAENPFKHSLAR